LVVLSHLDQNHWYCRRCCRLIGGEVVLLCVDPIFAAADLKRDSVLPLEVVSVFVFAEKEDTGNRGNMMVRHPVAVTKAKVVVLSFFERSNESRRIWI
jgi:sulfur transfer complex TusBCD TusB component (DsrH family)